eukprot:17569_1
MKMNSINSFISLLLILLMNLFQVYSIIYCNDDNTNSKTNMNDDIVNYWGFLGCTASEITATEPQIDIVAYYTSSNSVFDSNYKQLPLSGYSTQFHCHEGASCIINYELNGCTCQALTVYYYDNINQIVMHPEICIQSPGSNSGCVACPKIETLSVSST